MHMDPLLPALVGIIFVALALAILLRRFEQPSVVAYVLTGAVLGPNGMGVVSEPSIVARIGEIGVVLLLFFAGMELSIPELKKGWRVPVVGTALQIAASVGCVSAIGFWRDWPLGRIVLLGFVISLSSTAVVLKLLREKGELNSPIGRDVVGILLVQDVAIIPMLMAIGFLAGDTPSATVLTTQLIAGAALVALLGFIASREHIPLPVVKWLDGDKELQILGAFALAFGLAFATGVAGLSVALGAFVGGVVVGASRETHWIHEALYPFHVLFLAVFFVSIGMMIDPGFTWGHLPLLSVLLVVVLVTNTFINAVVLRTLGRTWASSIYGGAMLSQIGEFSFVLAAVGLQVGLIEDFSYQITIAVIALTLVITPLWTAVARRIGRPHDLQSA